MEHIVHRDSELKLHLDQTIAWGQHTQESYSSLLVINVLSDS